MNKYLFLGLSKIQGIGEKTLNLFFNAYNTIGDKILSYSKEKLKSIGVPSKCVTRLFFALRDIDNLIRIGKHYEDQLNKRNVYFFLKEELPEPLKKYNWLFFSGNLDQIFDLIQNFGKNYKVAFVGTRHPDPCTPYKKIIKNYVLFLKSKFKDNLYVVSGMADGIDKEAHLISFEENVPTVAILGFGLDYAEKLMSKEFKKALKEGNFIAVSQFLPDKKPSKESFLCRNNLIVDFSEEIVFVQGKIPSGTYSTLTKAIKTRKPVVIPNYKGNEEFYEFIVRIKYPFTKIIDNNSNQISCYSLTNSQPQQADLFKFRKVNVV
ncbi:hypothetical protein DRN73_08630 [Candidatus Pacearchaeota archaeon]|nr:MAG: hypothetical protein DRN73_08630 [Candidatus Pacearchaeota archaeon]